MVGSSSREAARYRRLAAAREFDPAEGRSLCRLNVVVGTAGILGHLRTLVPRRKLAVQVQLRMAAFGWDINGNSIRRGRRYKSSSLVLELTDETSN